MHLDTPAPGTIDGARPCPRPAFRAPFAGRFR